jgi:hypothetical protein
MCLKYCLIGNCKKDTYNIIHYVNIVKKIQFFFCLVGHCTANAWNPVPYLTCCAYLVLARESQVVILKITPYA